MLNILIGSSCITHSNRQTQPTCSVCFHEFLTIFLSPQPLGEWMLKKKQFKQIYGLKFFLSLQGELSLNYGT